MNTETSVVVWGERMYIGRPEMRCDGWTYPVPTPSAGRGILDRIFWHPQMKWEVLRIAALRLGPFARVAVNERSAPGCGSGIKTVRRVRVIRRDCMFRITARFHLTELAGPEDSEEKFLDQINKRIRNGACACQPSLGIHEFVAFFAAPSPKDPSPLPITKDLGVMFADYDWSTKPPKPLWFRAKLEQGVMHCGRDLWLPSSMN